MTLSSNSRWMRDARPTGLRPIWIRRAWQRTLHPFQTYLDQIEVRDPGFAHRICRLIPAQCPFERNVVLLGRTLAHIPPLCKLNPFYDQVTTLRFRALSYLADECNEDITPYVS